MKTPPQLLVVQLIGAFALGTLFLILGAVVLPSALMDLPRVVILAIFYGGTYLFLRWMTPVAQTVEGDSEQRS